MATTEEYGKGFTDGYREALVDIYTDLEAMTDEDGSLNGGDTVEYIYALFATHDILDDDDHLCEFDVPIPGTTSTDIAGGILRGTRDDLLLLARNIHDTLEGHDHGN